MSEYIPRLQQAIASSIGGMTREQLLWKPDDKWSIAEVLEHLYLSYTGTSKGCERGLGTGKPLVTPPTLAQRIKTFAVVTVGHYPRGIQAPPTVCPNGLSLEQVTGGIQQQISTMDGLLRDCEEKFGKNAMVLNHPVLSALTGDQWRKFHWLHGQHHVRQILELREKASVALEA